MGCSLFRSFVYLAVIAISGCGKKEEIPGGPYNSSVKQVAINSDYLLLVAIVVFVAVILVVVSRKKVLPQESGVRSGQPYSRIVGSSPRIFISYRRSDSLDISGRVYDRLVTEFGAKCVFKDIDTIRPGQNIRVSIENAIRQADLIVAIIGPSWVDSRNGDGGRRLDDPRDFVRLELEISLQQSKIVIPVLIAGASMPMEGQVPSTLAEILFINAAVVRTDPDFHSDMDRLIKAIKSY